MKYHDNNLLLSVAMIYKIEIINDIAIFKELTKQKLQGSEETSLNELSTANI